MKALLIILFGFITLNASGFDAELKSYLKGKFSAFEKFEYQIVQSPNGFVKMEVNRDKSFRLVKENAYVPVVVFNEKNITSYSLLTVKVKLYKTVLIAKQNLSKDEDLVITSFEKKLENVAAYTDKVVDENGLVNYRSKIMIKSGSILTSDMIEEIPVVNKGSKVIVHAGKNGVDIAVDALTRQDGCVGDVISVQSSNKIFKAKVIDKFNLTLVE